MLRTIAVALLVTGMSFGIAEAKGAKAKPVTYCQTEQMASANCACGPAKMMCKKGQWCHAFSGTCTQ